MKIAVNTRLLRKNAMDGIGWFTYNTLKKITVENPQIEFHFFFDSGIDEAFLFSPNIVPHNLFPPAKHALLNIAWFEWSVKRKLQKINPDLFLSPDGILCLGWQGKQYGVIHDLNFYHMPEVLKYSNRRYYNYFFPKYAQSAARIGTVSEFSKQDIVQTFGIPEDRVDVLYNGINPFFTPVSDLIRQQTKKNITGSKPYFVFAGTLSPRKNVLGLLKAFEIFRTLNNTEFALVIAGGNMYKTNELFEYKDQMRYGSDVFFTGRLGDEQMNNVIGSAEAMVFVPFFEGFGIPPIEAMQCGVPVIASNTSSVPEITGDAALLVDPHDPRVIAEAMLRVVTDGSVKNTLIANGAVRKNFFSWDKTADLLWTSVNKIL